MERLSVPRSGLALTASLLLSTHFSPAEAALLTRFDFEDANGSFTLAADLLASNFSTGQWHDADGTAQGVANNPGFALSARSFHDGNRLLLTLSPAAGFSLQLSGVDFGHRASGTGPLNWELALAGNPVASGSTATTLKTEHIALGALQFDTPLELALLGSAASSSQGTWRIDNFELHGAVQPIAAVPIPALGWLFGGAVLGLVGQRRGVSSGG